jgi:hypothetical protein
MIILESILKAKHATFLQTIGPIKLGMYQT